MPSVRAFLCSILELRAPAVLATLVQGDGTLNRYVGAWLLADAEGFRLSSTSVDCLASTLHPHVRETLDSGAPRCVHCEGVLGAGGGCTDGAVFLLEPLLPGRLAPWIPFCEQRLAKRESCALATVLQAPEGLGLRPGERFAYDARSHGLLPMDPGVSVALHRLTRTALEEDRAFLAEIPLPQGTLQVLVEPLHPTFQLWIYGAEGSARSLAAMALCLGWEVGIVDPRGTLVSSERFPGVHHLEVGMPRMDQLRLDARSAVAVFRHRDPEDRAALKVFLASEAAYVGLKGRRNGGERLLNEFETEGFFLTQEMQARLHCPMGLDLGGDGPEAMALASLAEMQGVIHRKR